MKNKKGIGLITLIIIVAVILTIGGVLVFSSFSKKSTNGGAGGTSNNNSSKKENNYEKYDAGKWNIKINNNLVELPLEPKELKEIGISLEENELYKSIQKTIQKQSIVDYSGVIYNIPNSDLYIDFGLSTLEKYGTSNERQLLIISIYNSDYNNNYVTFGNNFKPGDSLNEIIRYYGRDYVIYDADDENNLNIGTANIGFVGSKSRLIVIAEEGIVRDIGVTLVNPRFGL